MKKCGHPQSAKSRLAAEYNWLLFRVEGTRIFAPPQRKLSAEIVDAIARLNREGDYLHRLLHTEEARATFMKLNLEAATQEASTQTENKV